MSTGTQEFLTVVSVSTGRQEFLTVASVSTSKGFLAVASVSTGTQEFLTVASVSTKGFLAGTQQKTGVKAGRRVPSQKC